jgi:hypothetical protein
MPSALNLKGKRFGRLLVVEKTHIPNAHNAMWKCQCDCGNATVAAAANIGRTTFSCGCLAKETAAALLRGNTYTRTHNQSHTPEHDAWGRMQQRCYNPNDHKYPIYGARGITICQRWLDSFENFYADMGPRPSPKHSIDRYPNNDGNYEPENCRWATNPQQSRNKRTNNWITIEGVTLCLVDWCDRLGIPRWKPHEMCRKRGAKRNLPPTFTSSEKAIRHLYERAHR